MQAKHDPHAFIENKYKKNMKPGTIAPWFKAETEPAVQSAKAWNDI